MTPEPGYPLRVAVCRPVNPDASSILKAGGFIVHETQNLKECLDKFRIERCHLIVIDYESVKGVDGWQDNVFELISHTVCTAPCFVLCRKQIPVAVAERMRDCDFFPINDNKKSIDNLPIKIRKVVDKDRAVELEIRWTGEDEKINSLTLDKKDVHWVLSHLLSPETYKLHVDEAKKRKNSIVMKCRVAGMSQSLFIKVGRADKVRQEIENYYKNIHWRLINTNYAFMEKHKFWYHLDLGGIIYTFLGSRNLTETFSDFYRHEEIDLITNVITVLFDTLNKGLYMEPALLSDNLFEAYDHYLGLTSLFNNPLPDLEFDLPDPCGWVVMNREKSNLQKVGLYIFQARTHGDLWGENILVERIGNARSAFKSDEFQTWLIDFERAGLGHALRDFVELEVDIITRLAEFSTKDSLDFYELAISLTNSKKILERIPNPMGEPVSGIRFWTDHVEKNPKAQKAFRAVQQLRTSLVNIMNMLHADAREYYWGLLLDSLFLALNTGINFQQRKYAAIYAAVLAGRLDKWENDNWPPEEWKKVYFKESLSDGDKIPKNPKEHMV